MAGEFDGYFEAVRYLEGLFGRAQKKYGEDRKNPGIYLKRMEWLLDLMDRPDRGLKYVHVGGTAGKGSVCAMVHETLVAGGRKAGLFTKPFASTSIEKVKVNRKLISPREFADIAGCMKPSIEKAYKESPYGGPSYFEAFFALSLEHFRRAGCEWAVIEVGLGGRYDATNVIPMPEVSAITNIGYDHMNALGGTLEEIAKDKAGIIKNGSAFFTSEKNGHILDIFRKECERAGAEFSAVPVGEGHTAANRNLSAAIGRRLGLDEDAIKKGVENARLPCRFEIVQKEPAVVLDGAHNPLKMESVAASMSALSYGRLNLVIAVSGDKDSESILKAIVPDADGVFTTGFEVAGRKCTEPQRLAAIAEKYRKQGARIKAFKNPHEALRAALDGSGKRDTVLVTGSFFLAGELRKQWYPEQRILETRDCFPKTNEPI